MHKKPIKKILAYNGDYKKLLLSEADNIVVLNYNKNIYKNRKKIRNIVYILLIVLLFFLLIIVKLLSIYN